MNGTCRSLELGELNEKERLHEVLRIRNRASSMGMISAAGAALVGALEEERCVGRDFKVPADM